MTGGSGDTDRNSHGALEGLKDKIHPEWVNQPDFPTELVDYPPSTNFLE
jgi:hypothetical protein